MTIKSNELVYSKPVTSSRRGLVLVNKRGLWRGKPEKSLVTGKIGTGGRNVHGRITAPHRGGGHKRKYRFIDFKREAGKCEVLRIEYDPNRTAHIALIQNLETQKKSYIIATHDMKIGNIIESGEKCEVSDGNAMQLRCIPLGSVVHNIEMYPNGKGKLVRAAGTFARLIGRIGIYTALRLPSGETRKILSVCKATIGIASNLDNKNCKLAKAGRSRWMGRRPVVRGVAQNPVDHPLGGGEGKTSGGRHPVSRTGIPAKGYKTRDKKKQSNKLIISRRKK